MPGNVAMLGNGRWDDGMGVCHDAKFNGGSRGIRVRGPGLCQSGCVTARSLSLSFPSSEMD